MFVVCFHMSVTVKDWLHDDGNAVAALATWMTVMHGIPTVAFLMGTVLQVEFPPVKFFFLLRILDGKIACMKYCLVKLKVTLLRRGVWPFHVLVHVFVNLRSKSPILKVILLMSSQINSFRFRLFVSAICTHEMINAVLLTGATGGGANDWRGSWTHSTMDTSYSKFFKFLRILCWEEA